MESGERGGRGSNPERPAGRGGRGGRQWWARRWIQSIEALGLGERLPRGRHLARSGAVDELHLVPGAVTARLAAARGESFDVAVSMPPISRADWDRLQGILSRRALFAARLLSGEMPEGIEEAFAEAGLSLFPERTGELAVECTCGDLLPACRHAAAVLYLLSERFDHDPFQILLFRGRGREELLEELRRLWAQEGGGAAPVAPAEPDEAWQEEAVHSYGRLRGDLERLRPRIHPPVIPEAVLLRLGPPPGAEPDSPVEDALRRAYRTLSEWALRLAARETPGDDD